MTRRKSQYTRLRRALLSVALLATGAAGSQENSAEQPPDRSADRYRILWERNIFDPDRVKQRPADAPAVEEAPPLAEAQVRLILTGVLLVGDERTAFFEGSSSAFNTHGVEGGKVGDFTIETVRIDGVVLALESNRYELPLGGGVTYTESTGWTVEQSASGQLGETGASADETGEGQSVLEKLKARRQKELKK